QIRGNPTRMSGVKRPNSWLHTVLFLFVGAAILGTWGYMAFDAWKSHEHTRQENLIGALHRSLASCSIDCRGHAAGHAWAKQNDIGDPRKCGGDSRSFIAGCQLYVFERMDEFGERAELYSWANKTLNP